MTAENINIIPQPKFINEAEPGGGDFLKVVGFADRDESSFAATKEGESYEYTIDCEVRYEIIRLKVPTSIIASTSIVIGIRLNSY